MISFGSQLTFNNSPVMVMGLPRVFSNMQHYSQGLSERKDNKVVIVNVSFANARSYLLCLVTDQ